MPDKVFDYILKIRNNYFDGYALKSYSQEGEDMILRRMFEKQDKGFYTHVNVVKLFIVYE